MLPDFIKLPIKDNQSIVDKLIQDDSAPAGGFGFESSFGQTESPSDGKSSQIIPQKKAPSRPPPPRPNP